jgi:hypothetical protein
MNKLAHKPRGRSAAHAARALLATAVVVVVGAGCPIADNRDGIGRACATDDACPLDHFCALDGPVDVADAPAKGRCAPVVDYGACQAPTWPVKDGKTLEGDQLLTDPEGVVALDDVTVIDGALLARSNKFEDVCLFAGVQRVAGRVTIRNTDAETLDGLQALSVVEGGVLIGLNDQLTDVSALANLQFVPPFSGSDVGVVFIDNSALSDDAIASLRTALEPAGIKVTSCTLAAVAGCPLVALDEIRQR